MKTFLIVFLFGFNYLYSMDSEMMAKVVMNVINDERRRLNLDTFEYEPDTCFFAKDWADSTHRYFHEEKNEFSRAAAHRNCFKRMTEYEKIRGKEWKYAAECLGTGRSEDGELKTVISYAKSLLQSKDHYKILMNDGYKKLIIGMKYDKRYFSIVVFTVTDPE